MLLFLLPLSHPDSCNSWEKVQLLLQQTLNSVEGQSCSDFKTLVVGNTAPSVVGNYEFMDTASYYPERPEKDKAQKLLIGLEQALKYNPSYVMVVDPDDFLHKDLVKSVIEGKFEYGCYINKGYIYEGDRLIYLERDFQHFCGTSLIVKPELFPRLISSDFYQHYQTNIDGRILQPLAIAGAIYNRMNGQNLVAKEPLKESTGSKDVKFKFEALTPSIINDYNFHP